MFILKSPYDSLISQNLREIPSTSRTLKDEKEKKKNFRFTVKISQSLLLTESNNYPRFLLTSCGQNGACSDTQIALAKSAMLMTISVSHCLLVNWAIIVVNFFPFQCLGFPRSTTPFVYLSPPSASTVRALKIVFVAQHQEPPPNTKANRSSIDSLHPRHFPPSVVVEPDVVCDRLTAFNLARSRYALGTSVTRLFEGLVGLQQGNLREATGERRRENEQGSKVERYGVLPRV